MQQIIRWWVVADLSAPRARVSLLASARSVVGWLRSDLARRRQARDAAWARREVALRRAYFLAIAGGVR